MVVMPFSPPRADHRHNPGETLSSSTCRHQSQSHIGKRTKEEEEEEEEEEKEAKEKEEEEKEVERRRKRHTSGIDFVFPDDNWPPCRQVSSGRLSHTVHINLMNFSININKFLHICQ